MRYSLIPIVSALALGASAPAHSPDVTTFIIAQGKDTVSLEQFTRTGNTITGVCIFNAGQVQIHDFALTLGADGLPTHYDMAVGLPDGSGTVPLGEAKYSMTFGPDSLMVTTGRSRPVTRYVAIRGGAFPTFGSSLLGEELALIRLRATRAESGSVPFTTLGMGRAGAVNMVPARFIGADSAVVGTTRFKVDGAGHILGWRTADGDEGQRVPPIDVKRFEDALVAADAAAEAAARAEHVVTLSAETLDKLVGSYSADAATTFAVVRDGDKLVLRIGAQRPIDLLPASPTKFYLRRATSGVTLEFEVDSAGKVSALLLPGAGGTTQRVPKTVN